MVFRKHCSSYKDFAVFSSLDTCSSICGKGLQAGVICGKTGVVNALHPLPIVRTCNQAVSVLCQVGFSIRSIFSLWIIYSIGEEEQIGWTTSTIEMSQCLSLTMS